MQDIDIPFVRDSWINTLRYSCPALFWVSSQEISRRYSRYILDLVEQRKDLFRVAARDDDRTQLFGWSCGERGTTHFVYVKEPFRRQGIGAELISGRWTFSHWTRVCESLTRVTGYRPTEWKELVHDLNQVEASGVARNGELRREESHPDLVR